MLTLLEEIFIVVIGVGTLMGKKIIYCKYSVFLSEGNNKTIMTKGQAKQRANIKVQRRSDKV